MLWKCCTQWVSEWKSLSRVWLFETPWTVPGILQVRTLEWVAFPFSRGSSQPGIKPRSLPHCRQILYQLSHNGSPTTLEWVAFPFSRRPSRPRNWTGVSCIAGRFFTNWAISAQYASKSGKISSGYRTGKGPFLFQSQRKAMPKNVQTIPQLHSSHMLAK